MRSLRTLSLALLLAQAGAFIVPTTPSTGVSSTRLAAERQDDMASRNEALKVALGAMGAMLGGIQAASGAVPTIQEYYGGQGSQSKVNSYIINGGRKGTPPPVELTPIEMPPPVEIIQEAQAQLDKLDNLVDNRSWGNIVSELKRPPLALIRAKYFGRKSLGELAGSLETPSFARGLENMREEAGMALTTLLDFSFSNRVIYFNEMDRAAVEALAAASAPPVDLDEPREALKEAKLLTKELAAML